MPSEEYLKLRRHAEGRGEEWYRWAQDAIRAKYKRQVQVRRYLPERSKHD